MWVKIDDQLHSHPKIQQAWHAYEAALGLHLLALSHAGCYLTDGYVSSAFVALAMPRATSRNRAIQVLEQAGLWDRNGDGWQIHDYLDYNDSRQNVIARRQADAARKRNGLRMES